jgi:hypothetical protein
MSKYDETGYSPLKTGILVVGGLVTIVTIVIAILIGTNHAEDADVQKFEACVATGQTAAECAVALGLGA